MKKLFCKTGLLKSILPNIPDKCIQDGCNHTLVEKRMSDQENNINTLKSIIVTITVMICPKCGTVYMKDFNHSMIDISKSTARILNHKGVQD